jgi:hypothetical protein
MPCQQQKMNELRRKPALALPRLAWNSRTAGGNPVAQNDSLGRPVVHGTTRKFLQVFGLKSLRGLPLVEQLQMPATEQEEEEADT